MYGGNVSGCSAAYNYEQAHRLFNNTPLPRAKRHGRTIWNDNERPLDDRYKHHYRIVQGHDAVAADGSALYYDMVLYHTVMARYYKPTSDGAKRVLYANDTRNTSSAFMWRVVDSRRLKEVATTEGVKVASPLYYNRVEDPWFPHNVYDSPKFSAALWFDADGRLDVSKSQHTPHCRYVSSPEDKAKRKALKAKFDNLLMLAVMRLPEFEREAKIDYYAGRPFRSAGSWAASRRVEDLWDLCRQEGAPGTEQVMAFFDVCQSALNTLASKRAYAQVRGASYYNRRHAMATSLEELQKPITPEEFTRSVFAKLVKLAGVDSKSERVMLPQFMPWDDYPRTGVSAV